MASRGVVMASGSWSLSSVAEEETSVTSAVVLGCTDTVDWRACGEVFFK